MKTRQLSALGFAIVCAACGGKVVFVQDDGGGAQDGSGAGTDTGGAGFGGSSSSISPNTSSGSPCDALAAELEKAINAANACNPFLNLVQCDGSAVVNDTCGCPAVLANETTPDLVEQAGFAYAAWTQAGCGPFPCESCTPATSGFCEQTGDGSTGICTSAFK